MFDFIREGHAFYDEVVERLDAWHAVAFAGNEDIALRLLKNMDVQEIVGLRGPLLHDFVGGSAPTALIFSMFPRFTI